MFDVEVDIKIMDERLFHIEGGFPNKAKSGDAAYDVYACIDESIVINPNKVELIPLGFAMHIENELFAATLIPRSGQGHKEGIVLGNLTGLIDSGYQGQVYASVWNRNSTHHIKIEPLQKIAQLRFVTVPQIGFNYVNEFKNESDRGDGGFGHTGK